MSIKEQGIHSREKGAEPTQVRPPFCVFVWNTWQTIHIHTPSNMQKKPINLCILFILCVCVCVCVFIQLRMCYTRDANTEIGEMKAALKQEVVARVSSSLCLVISVDSLGEVKLSQQASG